MNSSSAATASGRQVDVQILLQENYSVLLKWALAITKGDESLAQDLVHDVSVKFLSFPSVMGEIENVHGYFRTSLKNCHISHIRKQRSRREIAIDESIDDSVIKPSSQTHRKQMAKETLEEIAEYLLQQETRTLASSILILRFIHDLKIREIAEILRRPRNSIDSRLSFARREIAEVVRGKNRLKKRRRRTAKEERAPVLSSIAPANDLQVRIFSSKIGECLDRGELLKIYRDKGAIPTREQVAHLVGCELCLAEICTLLSIKRPRIIPRHLP
jgi:RNA polymerase sigma factor (sigma-70 family)